MKPSKPNAIRIDCVAGKFIAYVVDRYGDRIRSLGSVVSPSFGGARAEAGSRWPDLTPPKYYG